MNRTVSSKMFNDPLLSLSFEDWTKDFFDCRKNEIAPVEISEIDKEVIVRIAYPGVTLENWDIEVCDNMLNVKAKRDVQESNYNLVYCNSTFFSKSSFSTSFKLPQNVDTSTIEASYKDGILKITIPKSTASTSAKISVK